MLPNRHYHASDMTKENSLLFAYRKINCFREKMIPSSKEIDDDNFLTQRSLIQKLSDSL